MNEVKRIETLDAITAEVVQEQRDEIKELLKESIRRGIKSSLEDSYWSPIKSALESGMKQHIAELFEDAEIQACIIEQKPVILDGLRTASTSLY
jgi:hypothetical protein